MLNTHHIVARNIPDLWFQAINNIFIHGRKFTVDKGSYEGQTRLEYDYFTGHILYPHLGNLLPDIPQQYGIPNPVDEGYIFGSDKYERSYIEYLMSPDKGENESYTYGQRLTAAHFNEHVKHINKEFIEGLKQNGSALKDTIGMCINQIDWVIETYKKHGYRNNQMILQVAQPQDIALTDPPCLRHIDTRIQDNQLHFFIYFRSWDLWGGLPANLAGIQILKSYMAAEIGVKDGEMIVSSKGLHLYGYAEDLAKLRCGFRE